jgi:DhnA family fructose-bisphosphate aldolase class Ia
MTIFWQPRLLILFPRRLEVLLMGLLGYGMGTDEMKILFRKSVVKAEIGGNGNATGRGAFSSSTSAAFARGFLAVPES